MAQLNRPCSPDRILKIFFEITLIFVNVVMIAGKKGGDVTSDVQIPMMFIVVLRSKLKNLNTLVDFIEKFSTEDIHTSVFAHTLTLLKGVVCLIEELDHKKLGMT